jgi:hypothetical protein
MSQDKLARIYAENLCANAAPGVGEAG